MLSKLDNGDLVHNAGLLICCMFSLNKDMREGKRIGIAHKCSCGVVATLRVDEGKSIWRRQEL